MDRPMAKRADVAEPLLSEPVAGSSESRRSSPDAKPSNTGATFCLLLLAWWLSAAVVVSGLKYVLQNDLPFPLLLSAMCNLCTTAYSGLLVLAARKRGSSYGDVPDWSWTVVLIGVLQGTEIALANYSLKTLSVTDRTLLHACGPLGMFFIASVFGLESLSCRLAGSIALVSLGSFLAMSQDTSEAMAAFAGGDGLEIGAVLSMLCALMVQAARWCMTQRLLKGVDKSVGLILLTAPLCALVCGLASVFLERELPSAWSCVESLALGVGVMVITISELELVTLASAVTLAVAGVFHNFFIMAVGVVWVHSQKPTLMQGLGLLISQFGALAYYFARSAQAMALGSSDNFASPA